MGEQSILKATRLREQTDEELRQALDETVRARFDVQVRKTTGDGSTHPVHLRGLRRDIARIKTVLRERKAGQ